MKFIINLINLYKEKDPAIKSTLEVFLYPGLKAILYYKVAHFFYLRKHFFLARLISEKAKRKTGIEIHPGAQIGNNLFIDHGTGIVIGETAIIKDNVTIYHGVTLGSLKLINEKRHPTIEDNVIIGTHATILGNITIGQNSKIGANAVVLKDVPPNTTAVGVPSKNVRKNKIDYKTKTR